MLTAGSMLPCQVRMESMKFQRPTILGINQFTVISKLKRNHQILRNQKLQFPSTGQIRLQNTERHENMVVCCSFGAGSPIPSNSPPDPGSWIPWILGILLSIILPFWRGKWGPLLKLKEEAETVIDTVEAVTDVVEKVAEQVEKVADDIGDHLPEGRLKDAVEYVEDMAEDTADGARLAGEFIDKLEDIAEEVEEEVESFMESNSTDEQAKKAVDEEAKGHA